MELGLGFLGFFQSVDFVGFGFLSHVTKSGRVEKDEVKRRKLLWALYLMREPFFGNYTRQKLQGTERLLEPVPLIGTLTGKFVVLIVGAQTRYTYMSGS
ncbi:hypothetical protein F3Y22_tig00111996pilonHSYRG00248 [Hibiscus syriacus]|uniref:Peroxisomal membrane protein PEX16 n=1 Tax=Hibiscus syriacus TaxID=106335 RepID=A0A6A2YCW7_HIBSY|nr:hypothetical protein F3Y22_tig00111996pilonHSYRG00248 [Hibiscus syriacus]